MHVARRPATLYAAIAGACTAALLMRSPAHADLVTGKVSGGGFKGSHDTLSVFLADSAVCTLHTSDKGTFARVLSPGSYRVEFRDRNGVVWSSDLTAEDAPVHLQLHLKKKPKHSQPQ